MKDSQARKVGPWVLHDRIGRGGNATVWKAARPDLPYEVAVKIINTTKVEREPYKRFIREIGFLREHQDYPGLLPLLDSYLPDQPNNEDPAWLAMPLATPVARALEGRSLADVVKAVAAVADTLARLRRDFGVAHRDIKPGNLYELDGAWLVGDFGLIALPGAEALTADGRQVGPAHYTAYEMISHPTTADPHPADVYSLGKTLWVLATGQTFPPEGHQPVGTRGFEIGDFRPHPRADALDQEVDLMTRLHPQDRPSKDQVALDLAAWQTLSSKPVVFDVSAVRARLRAKLNDVISHQNTLQQYKDHAYAAVRQLQRLTTPLNEGLKSLYPRTEIDSPTDTMTQNILKSHLYASDRELVFRWQRCTRVAPFDHPGTVSLRMSRCLELLSDGVLVLHSMVHVGRERVVGVDFDWRVEPKSAPVGTVEAEQMLDEGVRELADALTKGLAVFVEQLPNVN